MFDRFVGKCVRDNIQDKGKVRNQYFMSIHVKIVKMCRCLLKVRILVDEVRIIPSQNQRHA